MQCRGCLAIFLVPFVLVLPSIGAAQGKTDSDRTFYETSIAPDLSILAEISDSRPYVGQQISAIYTLRAKRFPAAVDVQPQQFPGFWTELVPPPEQARTILRVIHGRALQEFLLRRVVAFPLVAGELRLPPLEVKVKMSGVILPGAENWDLIASSDSVTLQIQPLPPRIAGDRSSSLVGTLQGRLTEGRGERDSDWILEMDGTANLAFFRPEECVRIRGGSLLPPRLLSFEREVESQEASGGLTPRVSYRQRWEIRVVPSSASEGPEVEDMQIPIFENEKGLWGSIWIRGHRRPSKVSEKPNVGPITAKGESGLPRWVWPAIAFAAVVAALGAAAIGIGRRKSGSSTAAGRLDISTRSISALKKQVNQAPRAFLETAHRILLGYAEENQISVSTVDEKSMFGRLWKQVEAHRFVDGNPTSETRAGIFQSIQSLLAGKVPQARGAAQEHAVDPRTR